MPSSTLRQKRLLYRWGAVVGMSVLVAVVSIPLVRQQLLPPAQAVHPSTYQWVGPGEYDLALGASLAYGSQPNRITNMGYAQQWFTNDLQPHHGVLSLTNFGCPGENSTDFISYTTGDGCRGPIAPHNQYCPGCSQLGAANNVLTTSPYQYHVSPVTLSLGADDLTGTGGAFDDSACIVNSTWTSKLAQLDYNLTQVILPELTSDLKQNGVWTGDLIILNYYDVYNYTYPLPSGDQAPLACRNAIMLLQELNQHLANDAALFQLPPPINIWSAPGFNPNQICTYTWRCSPPPNTGNPHPTTDGYGKMVQAIEAVVPY